MIIPKTATTLQICSNNQSSLYPLKMDPKPNLSINMKGLLSLDLTHSSLAISQATSSLPTVEHSDKIHHLTLKGLSLSLICNNKVSDP